MSTGNASLILCTSEPLWLNHHPARTVEQLKTLGLCADSIQDRPQHFYTGEKFLDFIAFMGCAPTIRFNADQPGETFTCIKIINSPDKLLFRSSALTRAPRCPHCDKAATDWQQKNINASWSCMHCAATAQPYQYHWRQLAGFGHFFIEITDVYPKEAIPQPALLDKLGQWHGVKWRYFYC